MCQAAPHLEAEAPLRCAQLASWCRWVRAGPAPPERPSSPQWLAVFSRSTLLPSGKFSIVFVTAAALRRGFVGLAFLQFWSVRSALGMAAEYQAPACQAQRSAQHSQSTLLSCGYSQVVDSKRIPSPRICVSLGNCPDSALPQAPADPQSHH